VKEPFGPVKEKTFPFLPNTRCAFVVISRARTLLHAGWYGRAAISVDNAKPRTAILDAYYARPPEEACWTAGCPDMRQSPVGEPAEEGAVTGEYT
jgi:hypothetical protein